MSDTIWRVVATADGFYDQIYRSPGEVFDLLNNDDGTVPQATRYIPKIGTDGKEIPDAGTYEPLWLDEAAGEPLHRDFASDTGGQLQTSGPMKGEVVRYGWMKRVSLNVQVGIYPADYQFSEFGPAAPIPQRKGVEGTGRPHTMPKGQRGARAQFGG